MLSSTYSSIPLEILSGVRECLRSTEASAEGIEGLVRCLGYQTLQPKDQPLDPDTLFQQKDLRSRIVSLRKLVSVQASWRHPISHQTFSREAAILVIQVTDESVLATRWPFEMTRYAAKFGLMSTQAIFFFVTKLGQTFVATTYESIEGTDRVQVRRLVVDLNNVARTDVESLAGISFQLMTPDTIVDRFRGALPYLKVGNEFFGQYRGLFQTLARRLSNAFDSQKESYGYAQRLLGRITFLYFLQRKGWLDGNRAYLRDLSKMEGQKIFDSLYQLFDALNTEGAAKGRLGSIPYLNGSLFEPEQYPQARTRRIGQACSALLPEIMNAFNQYNFTISESTPLNKEVAVDPELLGSLFESMLPETERGAKGTFYTHQEEMLFMAREAIRLFLKNSDLVTDEQALHLAYGLEAGSYPTLEPKIARELKDKVRSIKILDPAVGSGGFLMAALQALLETRTRLNSNIGTVETDYDVKLETIENNLFGVDIEEEAIELARLRLWLTLVVDESVENVRPLPNLDYNLHGGDSLKLPEFEKLREIKLTVDDTLRTALLREISSAREEYSRAHGKDKEKKRKELNNTLKKLIQIETGSYPAEPIPFSFRYFFADVIAEGGFDVVLMNPPYITQEEIGRLPGQNPKRYKSEIITDIQTLTEGGFNPNRRSDIAVYFLVRSALLLKEGGVSVVIATSKWLDAAYGIPLQAYFLKHAFLDSVFDCIDRSFSAEVNTTITTIRRPAKSDHLGSNTVRFVFLNRRYGTIDGALMKEILKPRVEGTEFLDAFRISSYAQESLYNQGLGEVDEESNDVDSEERNEKLSDQPDSRKVYIGTKWGNLHLHSPPVYHRILERGKQKLVPLGDQYGLIRGPVTGANDFFILEEVRDEADRREGLIKVRNGFGKTFLVEREYCPRVLMRTDEDTPYETEEKRLGLRIFLCRKSRKELKGTYALRYVEWGERSDEAKVKITQGKDKGRTMAIPDLSTVSSRADWYQVPMIRPTGLLCPQAVKNKQIVLRTTKPVYFEHRFYGVYADSKELDLWLYLNSAVFRLFLEMNGRTEGAGALSVMVYEYKQCPVIHPMPSLSGEFKHLDSFRKRQSYRLVNISEQGPLEFEQEDRKELDELVLKHLGFNKEERQRTLNEIYVWLRARVNERLTKAKSGPEGIGEETSRGGQADLREFA